MPGVVDLVRLWSLDVARGLVAQGLGLGFNGRTFTSYTSSGPAAPLGIVDASNTTPVVLTTDRPHYIKPIAANGYPNELHAVVQGVEGNTAANCIDANPRSRTKGKHLGVKLVPLTDNTFSMYLPSYTTGLLEAVSGNGAYTGGGTIKPGLTAGRMLLGRQHTRFEFNPAGAAPFLAIVPVGNEFSAPGDRRVAHGAVGITAEQRNELEFRAIGTDKLIVEIHSWGTSPTPDPEADFDITQRLYQQALQSLHLLGCGSFLDRSGSWEDQRERATQIVKLGHYHVSTVALWTPLLEFGMPFVPTPITPHSTTEFDAQDGSLPEVGCTQG